MAVINEKSGFFNGEDVQTSTGIVNDRTYFAEDFAKYFSLFIGDGVFYNPVDQLKVIASDGLKILVTAGNAFIEGYWYELKEDFEYTFNPSTKNYTTNNIIGCELNKTNREIKLFVKEGVSDTKPVKTEYIHQLVFCVIPMRAGQVSISNSDIKDVRMRSDYCGFVETVVKQLDFSKMFMQYDAEFYEWFEKIKGQLSGDVAGKLVLQVNEIEKKVKQLQDSKADKQHKHYAYEINDFLDSVYPVGSIYWTSDKVHPRNLFGGEWVQITDRFVLAAGRNYETGEIGGEAEHVLTEQEMPRHEHFVRALDRVRNLYTADEKYIKAGNIFSYITSAFKTFSSDGKDAYRMGTESKGENKAHNNMPPYIVRYCWERIA